MKKITILVCCLMGLASWAQTGTPTRPAGQAEPPAAAGEVKQIDSDSADEVSTRVPVPTGKYITGGVLGSAAGFGIGHGIQGRYSSKGWIYTATEAMGVLMWSAGCSRLKDRDGDGDRECENAGLALAGFGIAVGFHIWEVVDVWTGARPVDESEVVAFLLPDPKSPGLMLGWRF